MTRRRFVATTSAAAVAAATAPAWATRREPAFRISLAEWSLHRELWAGELKHTDFARTAREDFDIGGIEYVNSFFRDKTVHQDELDTLKKNAADHDVRSLLIMCDGEGEIGNPDERARQKTVDNHVKWLEAAAFLGCHSIRVNAASRGTWDEQQKLAADGLARLVAKAKPFGLNVIVENHGGLSSNGEWLAGVMKIVDDPRCGTLPDFGNFCLDWERKDDPDQWYDRYKGVAEMMPYAKAVSAKSHEFGTDGDETQTDYVRMLRIVLDAGYHGYVGIEYEGDGLSERQGIAATKKLLERVRADLA